MKINTTTYTSDQSAFTALELLVVIAVIVAIGLTLLPALANTRVSSQVFRCQNNLKQLTAAWAQYSGEDQDQLMDPTAWAGGAVPFPPWTLDWSSGSNNTNTVLLFNGPIGTYLRSPAVFKCPADKYQSASNPGPRDRSVSLNGNVGGNVGVVEENPGDGSIFFAQGNGTGPSRNLSDLNNPGPARVFVMLDEQADSLVDGAFAVNLWFSAANEQWRDLPAGYHNGAGSFSFADGHTEIHLWQNPKLNPTLYSVTYTASRPWQSISGKSPDYEWVRGGLPYR